VITPVSQPLRWRHGLGTGLAIPFLLSAWAVNALFPFFSRVKRYIELVHVGGGLLLFNDSLTVLHSWAIQLTPAWLWERL
jgi:hypothetical protein